MVSKSLLFGDRDTAGGQDVRQLGRSMLGYDAYLHRGREQQLVGASELQQVVDSLQSTLGGKGANLFDPCRS